MSTSSIKAVPTLKGLFNDPKPSHRRDFLRENKLSLRELQRITNDKQTELQNNKKQQFFTNKRRSASQQRSHDGGMPLNGRTQARSVSQQRNANGVKQNPAAPAHDPRNMSRCPSCCGSGSVRNDVVQKTTLSATCCNKQIQTEDINDEQFLYDALKKCTTYDMKRQSAEADTESNYYQHDDVAASVANLNIHGDKSKERGSQSIHNAYGQHNYRDQPDCHGHYHQDTASQAALTARSQASFANFPPQASSRPECGGAQNAHFADGLEGAQTSHRSRNLQQPFGQSHCDNEVCSARSANSLHSLGNVSGAHLNGGGDGGHCDHNNVPATQRSRASQRTQHLQAQHGHEQDYGFEQRSAFPHDGHHAQHMSQPLSGRSQQSTGTQNTTLTKKKSVANIHRLGSRDDIRLPRYLEREKREKEEHHARELLRDVNCPAGHYQLSEDERLAALTMTEKKFQDLINELNRMPMTTQTLRIRTRKAEIEKELVSIEADIRVFSKPKVYVKHDEYA